MKLMITEEQRPHSERMAKHWPRSIQEYWLQEQERADQSAKQIVIGVDQVDSRQSMAQQHFAKRKCYGTSSTQSESLDQAGGLRLGLEALQSAVRNETSVPPARFRSWRPSSWL